MQAIRPQNVRGPAVFLNLSDVAERLGLKNSRSLAGVDMPPPDAMIGNHRGWKASTIDDWQANRPGRGYWGGR